MRNLERLNKERFLKSLKTKYIGRKVIYLEEIDSTNVLGKKLAKGGIEDGSLIVAETQTRGSGRFNRRWHSPKGGLWFTLILRPKLLPSEAPKITEIAAASMHETLKTLDIITEVKWPNDLLLNNKKICGILAEMKCNDTSIDYIILGTGLNVNIDKKEFNEEIKNKATSLMAECNKHFNKEIILEKFLETFEDLYTKFITNNDISQVIDICRENSSIFGKTGRLIFGDKSETIKCKDISQRGNLIVEDSEGNIKEITSGEVSFHN
ncbi:MAG: biotin--[acetyl-CoA-carboxylase] ligase [Clostridiaceae bacterium]|nr:biotin--[acetyl-CoA-carboxylase] ligase [Clostridiaceae bacterium]